MFQRYIPEVIKNQVLERQSRRCANSPNHPALNLADYNCPMWRLYGGEFDQAGWHFDHIAELSLTQNSTINNLQALCPSCHAVKTKRFMENKRQFTSVELNTGRGVMDIDKGVGAKRKYKSKSLSVTPQQKKRRTPKMAINVHDYKLTPEFLAQIYKKR